MKRKIMMLAGALAAPSCTSQLGQWSAADINDSGVIAGTRAGDDRLTHAVLYGSDRTLLQLPELPAPDSEVQAVAIANDGSVVGGTTSGHVVLWDASHHVHDLGQFRGLPSEARAMNNVGWIVGLAYDTNPRTRGWIRNPVTGRFIELPVPSAVISVVPNAINDAGEIAGYVDLGAPTFDSRAVKWTGTNRSLIILSARCGAVCAAYGNGIDSMGDVVGSDANKPVVWPAAGGEIELPVGDYRTGEATAINDAGIMVGYVANFGVDTGHSVAARWNAAHELELLGAPNSQSVATAINTAGAIVGRDQSTAVLFE